MQGSFSMWISHKKGPTRVKELARFKPMQRHLFLHEHALLFCKRREEHGENADKTPSYSFKHCLKVRRALPSGSTCAISESPPSTAFGCNIVYQPVYSWQHSFLVFKMWCYITGCDRIWHVYTAFSRVFSDSHVFPSVSIKCCLCWQMSAVGITENVKGDVKKFEIWYSGREEVYVIQVRMFKGRVHPIMNTTAILLQLIFREVIISVSCIKLTN